MDRASLIFCVLSLAVCFGIAAIAFPLASISEETLQAAQTPLEAEQMPDMDLGDFGVVPVPELLDYYLENPPEVPAVQSRKKQFEGC